MRLVLSKSRVYIYRKLVLVVGTGLCVLNFYSCFLLPVPQGQHDLSHWAWWTSSRGVAKPEKESKTSANLGQQQNHHLTTTTTVSHRQPTHEACNGYEGIYHIAMTDILGGVGTALIQLVLGQLLYAESQNLQPWVFLNNQSQVYYDPLVHGGDGQSEGERSVHLTAMVGRNATYFAPSRQSHRIWRDYIPGPPNSSIPVTKQKLYFEGTGVWDHYFEPVSDFVPGDRSCESKLYVTMDLYLITPGIHGFSQQYATRAWRYDYLPEYITQPHIPLHEWLLPQRQRAHKVLSKYIRFKEYLHKMAVHVNPNCNMLSNPCLGLHIRHSDKAAGRRHIAVDEFLPYALAFVQKGGTQIYLATDSSRVVTEIEQSWPLQVRSRVRTLGRQEEVIRSNNQRAVFDMAAHHRTNQEALVEILALSQCQFLVHGLSALSESSVWINLDLHYRSVNLEDTDHLNVSAFNTLLEKSINSTTALENLPHQMQTDRWWNQLLQLPERETILRNNHHNDNTCDEYKGVLHIAHVPKHAGVGQAFFASVLNQLLFARRLNLMPWVHLSCEASEILQDSSVSALVGGQNVTFEATDYVEPSLGNDGKWELSRNHGSETFSKPFQIPGCNLWNVYFDPVPNIHAGACRHKPVYVLNQQQVSHELETRTFGSIHAWNRDDLPDALWDPQNKQEGMDLKALIWPKRVMGHDIMTQYYRVRSPILQRAEVVNPIKTGDVCMAVHIRATGDKNGKYRKKVTADKYIPYLESFVQAGGNVIYIGTDSSRALRFLQKSVSVGVKSVLQSQGTHVVRSNSRTIPPYVLDDHHRVNSETLVDIYAMAKCHILLHSSSTVAEAVIYLNLNLHNTSVNLLEDRDGMDLQSFGRMVDSVVNQQNSNG